LAAAGACEAQVRKMTARNAANMTQRPRIPNISRAKGITLVEILLVVALLLIVLSFAIPSMSGASTRAEMTATLENVEHSIQMARNMARMNEASVDIRFEPASGEEMRVIAFETAKSKNNFGLMDYTLPESIVLKADQNDFTFDEKGLVEKPGRITLVARSDKTIEASVEVE
jgi:Tfp pilus assembly protein FimT